MASLTIDLATHDPDGRCTGRLSGTVDLGPELVEALTTYARGTIRLEESPSPHEAVVAWLESIDPALLDAEVLARAGGLAGGSPIVDALEVLQEWAGGR